MAVWQAFCCDTVRADPLKASWLKKGENEIIIFDLHKTEPSTVRGFKTINQN